MLFSCLPLSFASDRCYYALISIFGSGSAYRYTYGGSRLSRIPTDSSSRSNIALCSALLVASRIIRINSLVYTTIRIRSQ